MVRSEELWLAGPSVLCSILRVRRGGCKGVGERREGISESSTQQAHKNVLIPFFFPLVSSHRVAHHCTFLVPEFDALGPKACDDDVEFLGRKEE